MTTLQTDAHNEHQLDHYVAFTSMLTDDIDVQKVYDKLELLDDDPDVDAHTYERIQMTWAEFLRDKEDYDREELLVSQQMHD